jgi:hypothetical protein
LGNTKQSPREINQSTDIMKTIGALCLMLLAAATAAQEHFIDGDTLYERLQKQDASAMTYIFGVYDAIQIIQYHSPAAERYFCPPPAVTGKELADAILRHLERGESIREYPAAVLVLAGFIVEFPCGNLAGRSAPRIREHPAKAGSVLDQR